MTLVTPGRSGRYGGVFLRKWLHPARRVAGLIAGRSPGREYKLFTRVTPIRVSGSKGKADSESSVRVQNARCKAHLKFGGRNSSFME